MPDISRTEAVGTTAAVSLGALLLGVTSWSFNTDPMWAIISFVLVYDPDVQSARKAGLSRLALTVLGSVVAMAAVSTFGLQKWVLPLSLALTALICSTFLRSRAGWRVVLVTVALIVGSSLLQPTIGPYIAVTRSIEVTGGSLLAIVFSTLAARLNSRLTTKA